MSRTTRKPYVLTALLATLCLLTLPAPVRAVAAAGPTESVLLELSTESAAPAWRRAAGQARASHRSAGAVRQLAAEAGSAQRSRAGRALDELERAVRRTVPRARPLYRTQAILTGLAITAPASALPALRALPGVQAVHPISPKQRDNGYAVPLTGAPQLWAGGAAGTGAGVRIGIIDSGIDYTHADFGGPGTQEAYRAAHEGRFTGLFPSPKVIGGVDLVGDDYDPDQSSPAYQPVPHPGGNPLDCDRNGHGTHVAGIAAGLGVTRGGQPYHGSYQPGLAPADFKVAPGVAPGALLYAIRVFGCEGSTDQLAQALDLAADPDRNGDLSRRLDVVNLSLGSKFGSPDDADSVAADHLAELGTVVVAAAGNEGDVYAIGGSPGTAARAITVAASVDGHTDADGLRVLAPEQFSGPVPARWSEKYPFWAQRDVSGELAHPADQSDGCAAYSPADAERLRGRIAVLAWQSRDSDRPCGSAARADHAADAGAIGALYVSDSDQLPEIAGDDRVPAALLSRTDGEHLAAAEAAGTARVQLATPGNPLHGAVAQDQPQLVDTLASFTSRGIGVPGIVKPDVAAPGVTIWSAKAGSGSGGTREDGTSMATPHVAGAAALVRAVHPEWTPEQVKAALMNTAGDTWAGENHSGPRYGPERTGAGRIQVDQAVRTPALAYAAGEGAVPGAVGVSFGPVSVTGPTLLTREVEVGNLADHPLTYRTGYQPATELPGAEFRFHPSRLTVPPGGTARVEVTLTIPGPLDRAPDPTIEPVQAGHPRSYRSELSGRLLLTPEDDSLPALRVPLLAAPRPASQLTAGAAPGRLLTLSGAGTGLLSAFALGGEGPARPDCPAPAPCAAHPDDRAADLRAVGAATDQDGMLYLAATFWAPAPTPVGQSAVRALLDTDGDGKADVLVLADRLPDSDVLVARTVDARTGTQLDVQPLNARWGDTDTDLLDSDTVVLPVRLSALPRLKPGALRYGVWTGSTDEVKDALSTVGLDDGRPVLAYDPDNPPLEIRSGIDGPAAIAVPEQTGGLLQVRRGPGTPARLLLVHHLNADGSRAQLLDLG